MVMQRGICAIRNFRSLPRDQYLVRAQPERHWTQGDVHGVGGNR